MSQAAPTPRQKTLRIVLVDDEKYMLQLLETYLAQAEPDLLITDWQHPGLDGGELLRKLAEQHAQIPVLMITAYDIDCLQEFAKSGLKIVFLQKPFGVAQFWKTLDGLVGPCDHPPRLPKFLK